MAYQFTPRALPEDAHATADLVRRSQKLVSRRLRDLIERFEPGVHGFTPHRPTGDAPSIERYALRIGQTFDAVSPEHSTWAKESGVLWRPTGSIDERIIFDARVIAGRHLWTNAGLGSDQPDWASDALMAAASDQGMTGLLIDHHDQTDAAGQYAAPVRSINRVYRLSSPTPMRPNNPGVPLTIKAKLLDGDMKKLQFSDPSFSAMIKGMPGLGHGVPVSPVNVPTRAFYFQNAKGLPTDLFALADVPLTVSERFRDVIERIEPGVHQFLPIDFVDKAGAPVESRFIFVVCNQIDSVSREHSQMLFDRMWYNPGNEYSKIVHDAAVIGDRHVWRDKQLSSAPILYSAAVAEAMHAAGLDGLRYAHWELR